MSIVLLISFSIAIIYLLLIGVYYLGWSLHATVKSVSEPNLPKVSVIIPVRNEEGVILHCLNGIINQNYPPDLLEIIVVNDFSTDTTESLVKEFISTHANRSVLLVNAKLTAGKAFKKNAISQALQISTGEIIVTTDADCEAGTEWIRTIGAFYTATGSKMITGPVVYHKDRSLFAKIQALEFISLVACGAGSLRLGLPLMCNGANLAFEKKAFFEVKGYEDNAHIPSGDDTFLMMKLEKHFPGKVNFLYNEAAIVRTQAAGSLAAFISQRKRWSSKTKYYKSTYIKLVALIIFGTNLAILSFLIAGFFVPGNWKAFAVLFLTKSAVDFLFLKKVLHFFKRSDLLNYFIPSQLMYPLYVVFIGILAQFGAYKWKGRQI